MKTNIHSIYLLFVLFFIPLSMQAQLTSTEKQFLDQLFSDFLRKPAQHEQRVKLKVLVRDAWGGSQKIERAGWWNASEAKVYFADGEWVGVTSKDSLQKVDYIQSCRTKYLSKKRQSTAARMELQSLGMLQETLLVDVACLYVLKEEKLAQQILYTKAPVKLNELLEQLRGSLAWNAYAQLVHGYMVRADSEAWTHGQRFLKLYADQLRHYPQAKALIEDLERRKKEGKFESKALEKTPKSYNSWTDAKKIEYLIASLDEVDQRQWGQPGGVALGRDWRVKALIALGDVPVEALIDVLEFDHRFTRSVHFFRDFSTNRTVLSTKEVAVTVLMATLGKKLFEPVSTGDNFTARGRNQAQKMAMYLRDYWQKNKGKSYAARQMEILLNAELPSDQRRLAAYNLTKGLKKYMPGTTVFTQIEVQYPEQKELKQPKQNQLIQEFNNPSVAEAILEAMYQDLAKAKDAYYDPKRKIETVYLQALMDLKDTRILQQLNQKYQEAPYSRLKRKLAYACHVLGNPKPYQAFAKLLKAGSIKIDALNINARDLRADPGFQEIQNMVLDLTYIHTLEMDQVLNAFSQPSHPYFPYIKRSIYQVTTGISFPSFGEQYWFYHPYFFKFLYPRLSDQVVLEGAWAKVDTKDKQVIVKSEGGTTYSKNDFKRLNERNENLKIRNCDFTAYHLSNFLWGIPPFSLLLNPQKMDTFIKEQKAWLQRFSRFRLLSPQEKKALELNDYEICFVPVLQKDRAATIQDVQKGEALFELTGQGTVAKDLALPAIGVYKNTQGKLEKYLILQAEVDAKTRKMHLGMIGANGIKIVTKDSLVKIESLKK